MKIYIIEEQRDGKHWNEKVFSNRRDVFKSLDEQMKSITGSRFIMRVYENGEPIEVRFFQ